MIRGLPSLRTAIPIVRDATLARMLVHGYGWCTTTMVPAVRRVTLDPRRGELASYGHYVIGDLWDVLGAPKAAARAYRQSIRACPGHASAWRELGGRLEELGQIAAARRALERAVGLDPEDDDARCDLQFLIERGGLSCYVAGDPAWDSMEDIARGRLRHALSRLGASRGVKARLQRARVFGALGRHEAVVAEWTALEREMKRPHSAVVGSWSGKHDPREWNWEDWFFLPESVWDDARFWRIQWRLRNRMFPALGPLRPDDGVNRTFVERLRFHLDRTRRGAR